MLVSNSLDVSRHNSHRLERGADITTLHQMPAAERRLAPHNDSLVERGRRGTDPSPVMQLFPAATASSAPDKDQAAAFVDPASRTEAGGHTRQLALQQTISARDLLYHPGDTLRTELGLAAGKAHEMLSRLGDLQAPLGGHLFGAEGLMPGEGPKALLATLKRLMDDIPAGSNSATAKDRSIMIALMGDIGAILGSTTTGVERTPKQDEALRLAIPGLLGLPYPAAESLAPTSALGGSANIGPAKKQERIKPPNAQPARTGVHNLGKHADDLLGIQSNRLLPSRWDVAQLKKERVDTTVEPLIAHMSGTQAETLAVWDMLRGEQRPYTRVMDGLKERPYLANDPMSQLPSSERDARYARAAGTAAFLIGNGYHSAVEVLGGTLAYTGQDGQSVVGPRQDAGHLFGQGAATQLISELLNTQRAAQV
ncbi:hypothetical protein [Pseudomonas sp. R5-89-07]|uniref:hypothetical protein n=1 Tax=Pseudomonas sp. R5-89-07 TaxID=658644 RepID=UPI000F55A929|nr:hypothetical protein [Pseudomonas sp. R5-89-07]AZF03019.1 hypothetical protein C4J94_0218 [Pseudomonas sp. R5-89-07]